MDKRFELLVFDWDGTLHDSIGAIVAALQAACRDLDLPIPSGAHARHAIGLGLVDALRHSAPDLDETRYPELAERYKYHYLSNDQSLSLFEGVWFMIEELHARNHLLAVATGKKPQRIGPCIRKQRALDNSSRHPVALTNASQNRTLKCSLN